MDEPKLNTCLLLDKLGNQVAMYKIHGLRTMLKMPKPLAPPSLKNLELKFEFRQFRIDPKETRATQAMWGNDHLVYVEE